MSDPGDALLRWRLILGQRAEEQDPAFLLGVLPPSWPDLPDAISLGDLDQALAFIYEDGWRRGGTADPLPYLPRWLDLMRGLYKEETLAMVQKDAFERTGLAEFLLQPEILSRLEPNVQLAAALLRYHGYAPDTLKESIRQIIRVVVEELRRRLEDRARQTVIGALRRNRHTPLRTYRNLDWRTTIRRNLKHYMPERRTVVPERLYFWSNERRFRDWQVIILVDQSGSMAESAIYASIMATIFASLNALQTHLILFSTEIVDMSDYLHGDPVEMLFGLQLGGGTDIARAVAYGAQQVRQPEKCIFVLITDLYEGGNPQQLLATLKSLRESKVHVLCLLALEEGRPAYNKDLARQITALDIPTFAATPNRLLEVMERILRGGGG